MVDFNIFNSESIPSNPVDINLFPPIDENIVFPKNGKDGKSITVTGYSFTDDGNTRVNFSDGSYIIVHKGTTGDSPAFEWDGTSIRFKNPDGSWGDWVDLQGEQGEPGTDGDSITILSWNYDGSGNTVILFSDETSVTVHKGDKGDKGDNGDSITIVDYYTDSDGNTFIEFSDSTTIEIPPTGFWTKVGNIIYNNNLGGVAIGGNSVEAGYILDVTGLVKLRSVHSTLSFTNVGLSLISDNSTTNATVLDIINGKNARWSQFRLLNDTSSGLSISTYGTTYSQIGTYDIANTTLFESGLNTTWDISTNYLRLYSNAIPLTLINGDLILGNTTVSGIITRGFANYRSVDGILTSSVYNISAGNSAQALLQAFCNSNYINIAVANNTGVPYVSILSNLNVGFGTNSPLSNWDFLGSIGLSYTNISAGTFSFGNFYGYNFTGTTTTGTLPTISSSLRREYSLINLGSGNITLVVSGGGSLIYSISAVSSYTLVPGDRITLYNNGTYWIVNNNTVSTSLSSTYVGYGSALNTLTGTSTFIYKSSTTQLFVGGIDIGYGTEYKLQVGTETGSTGLIIRAGNTSVGKLSFDSGTNGDGLGRIWYDYSTNIMSFYTSSNGVSSSETLRINNNGRIAIGSTSYIFGGSKLEVNGSTYIYSSSGSIVQLGLKSTNSASGANLYIANNGGLGFSLVSYGSTYSSAGIYDQLNSIEIDTADTPTYWNLSTQVIGWYNNNAALSAPSLYIDTNGNIGMGLISSGSKLHVNGAIKTAAPSGHSAGAWKNGNLESGKTITGFGTKIVWLDVDGTVIAFPEVTYV